MSLQTLSQEEKQERVKELRKKIKADQLFENCPNADDTYLQRFLGGTSYDVNAAFDRMKTFYELLLEFPEWFTIDSPLKKKHIIEENIRVAIPETDKEGRPIYLVKLGNCNPAKMELMDVVAVDDIWLESIFLHYPTECGLCVIIDISNFPWKCFKWITPYNVKMAVKKIQTLPFKDFQFHVVKKHAMMHAVVKMIWPLLPEYLKQMVKFHFNDWQSFHSYIDPAVLPEEYGGTKEEINYDSIYQKLYEQNEQIWQSLTLSRNIQIN